jgi:proliferating cell nuclear antigen
MPLLTGTIGTRMYLKTVQSNAFKTLFEVLKEILHDVNISFDKDGMKIMTIDGSHVVLVHLRLDAQNFEVYECETPMNVGVNMSNLHKLLKVAGNQDTIVMSISESDASDMSIRLENADKKTTTTFRLKLMDVDAETLSMPPIEFDSIITLPSVYFQRMCKDMSNISDVVTIRSTRDSLVVSCKGDFASQETVIKDSTAADGSAIDVQSHTDETVEGTYMLKYMNLFNKASNLSNTLEMFMRKSYPLIMKYNVANLGELRFCLAPKADETGP